MWKLVSQRSWKERVETTSLALGFNIEEFPKAWMFYHSKKFKYGCVYCLKLLYNDNFNWLQILCNYFAEEIKSL